MENDEAGSIREALERATRLHEEVLRQVQELLAAEEVDAAPALDAPPPRG